MHSAVKKALMLAQNRRQYQTGGVPDDASQEAFLHEQLQGSAPQYDPQGGLETAKTAAQSLAGMTTPGAIADAAGYLGGPSALQNLRDQNYFDAALQLAAVVPGVGPLSKAAKLSKEAEEAANIKRYIERTSPDLSVARRYKTTEKAKETLKPGQRLVHTMIEDPPVIPPIKRAEGGPIDDHLTGSVELGQPDEASQEAFLQEQLQGSAPQYTPEQGMLTGKRAGLMAAGFAPGAGIATAAGQFPTAEGGKEPSMAEDWRKGEYLSAGLKGLGAAGDIAYGVPLVGPAVGAVMKAPLVAKLAMAAAPMAKVAKETLPELKYVNLGKGTFSVQNAGKEIGRANLSDDGLGDYLTSVRIDPKFQRKGIGSGLYDFVESEIGKKLRPSPTYQTPESESFWAARKKKLAAAPAAETVSRVTNPIGMYSAAAEAARALPQEKGTLQQMLATMKGVTPEELHWSGVHEAFAGKPTVTREELAKHFEERLPGVEETILSNPKWGTNEAKTSIPTKYEEHQLPGGLNYREVVLHLPSGYEPKIEEKYGRFGFVGPDGKFRDYWTRSEAEQAARSFKRESGDFTSQHWNQPNVLSHLRMSDRTGPEGEKVLHLEELQSDWGQMGRKQGFRINDPKYLEEANKEFAKLKRDVGNKFDELHSIGLSENEIYKNPEFIDILNKQEEAAKKVGDINLKMKSGIIPAPYVASPEGKHTLSWVDLGLKRALKEAAEGGYDKLIWTPGEEQAARYDLSKHINELHWNRGNLVVYDHDGKEIIRRTGMTKEELPDVVGKDVADKLLSQEAGDDGWRSLEGQDLKVGGEGMKKFYDKIVPSQLQKIVKKLDKDAKVQLGGYQLTKERQNAPVNAHVIQITPKMREAILKGFSAYASGGAVKPRNSSHLDPIIKRGINAVRRVKSQSGGSKTVFRRKDYEPVRGIKFHYPNEFASDQPDIQAYQMKRHAHEFIGSPEPEAPQRGVYVDAPLFGGRNKLFSMSYYYQPLVEKALNLIYGQKTTPFYYLPETAPIARAIDAYEAAKFVQRDPSNLKNYTGVPGTLMGLNKFGAPAVVAGAVAARDPENIEQKEPEKLEVFDYGETPEIISHPKSEPTIKRQAEPLKYAKGGSVDDEFHQLMAEADELLEKFKD